MSRPPMHHRSTAARPPRVVALSPRSTLPPSALALRPTALSLNLLLAGSLATGVGWAGHAAAQPAAPLSPAQEDAANLRLYSIPAGSLNTVLMRFLSESGVLLSGSTELAQGRNSPGVQGRYSPGAALAALLAGSGLDAVADAQGRFVLRPIPAATPGPTSRGLNTLAPVMVTATADREGTTEGTGSYAARSTRSATRLPLTLRETPQSVTVITSQQLEDRGVTGLAQAMETTTGVRVVTDMARPSLYSRGLSVTNLQIDGNPMFPSGQAMTGIQGDNMIAYDRIEVLRGANGLLTGPGDPSGTVTMVRKRPTPAFQAHVQGSLGSWSNRSGEADVSGPLNASGTVRGRLAVGAYDGHYFIDGKALGGQSLLATVEADLTPRTVARIGYQHDVYTYDGYSGGTTVPLWYSNGQPYNAPRTLSNTPRELMYDHRTRHLYTGLEHRFHNGWEFQGLVDLSRRDMKYPDTMFLMSIPNYPDPSGFGATLNDFLPYPTDDRQWAYNFDFQGPVTLFGREHRLMIGASGWDRERQVNERIGEVSGRPPGDISAGIPTAEAGGWFLPYPHRLTGFPRSRQYTEQNGIFAAARWNLADSLKLITGLRVTNWKTRSDLYNGQTGAVTQANSGAYAVRREITPYVGAVWDFHPNLSVYASYADIFKPQNLYDANDNLLEPVVGRNYELGLKGEFLDRRLNASAAIFRVVQDNLGERAPGFPTDYLTAGGNTPYRSAGKGITTQGVEVDVSGSLRPGWNIGAGFTYAQSENATGAPYDPDQPEHLLRAFTTYRLQGDWSAVSLGLGTSWNSAISRPLQRPTGAYQPNGQPVTAEQTFRQGSVWLLNAMARYEFTPKLSLLLNVDNLLDKTYYNSIASWAPVAYYGTPRRWRATLRYQF